MLNCILRSFQLLPVLLLPALCVFVLAILLQRDYIVLCCDIIQRVVQSVHPALLRRVLHYCTLDDHFNQFNWSPCFFEILCMLLSLQHHILYLLGSERFLVNYWVVNFLSKSPKGNNNEELPNPASHSLNSSQRFVFIFSSIREYHGKFYPDYVTICNWFNSVQPIRENFSQFVTYPNSSSVSGSKCVSSYRIEESGWFLLVQFLYLLG